MYVFQVYSAIDIRNWTKTIFLVRIFPNTFSDYMKGVQNTNFCPTGFVKISSGEECNNAALSFNVEYIGDVNRTYSPSGCYEYNRGNFYLNQHSIGSSNTWEAPVCKAGIVF